jgi:hypothetical protein
VVRRRGNGAAGGGRRHDRVPYGPSAPEAGAIKNQPRRHSASGVERCCKRLAELATRRRQSKYNPFFAAACTSQKTLLSLQVWNLFAYGEQIMRAADCNFYQKKQGFF